jgi:rhodanese-related sulfurtransferase
MNREREDIDSNQGNNKMAVIIGVVLVAVVAGITYFRFNASKSTNEANKKLNEQIAKPKISEKLMIAPDELVKKIQQGRNTEVIDIRDEKSFIAEHIVDSRHIASDKIISSLHTLNKDTTYVIIDEMGSLAPAIADSLASEYDYKNVFYVAGGFFGWKENYYPTVTDGDPFSFTDQSKVKYITSDELKGSIDNGDDLYILDVRRDTSYKDGHIKNAHNIYLGELEKRRREIPAGSRIILYDNDGLWAFKAAVILSDTGTYNTRALSDGFDAWKQKGFEVAQ